MLQHIAAGGKDGVTQIAQSQSQFNQDHHGHAQRGLDCNWNLWCWEV